MIDFIIGIIFLALTAGFWLWMICLVILVIGWAAKH